MNTQHPSERSGNTDRPLKIPTWVYLGSLAAVAAGALAFGLRVGSDPAAAWRALLINVLFWTSVSCGGFIWCIVFRITRTTWSADLSRLAHGFVRFQPVCLAMFVVLYAGRHFCLPWSQMNWGDRAWWMNPVSVFLRDGIALALLIIVSFIYVRVYLSADRTGDDQALPRADRRLAALAVGIALLYITALTLLGFDVVMPLTPGWHSALFGWYFALGGMYVGLATLIIASLTLCRWLGISHRFPPKRLQDMGNLLLGFAMAMTYFFYSQAIVIWYENLPSEISFALPRVALHQWRTMSWILLAVCYLGPFALLVVREMKENRRTLLAVAILVFCAVWYERYMLVAPSLVRGPGGLPAVDVILIGIGFFGALILTVLPYLARVPAESQLDETLEKERAAWA